MKKQILLTLSILAGSLFTTNADKLSPPPPHPTLPEFPITESTSSRNERAEKPTSTPSTQNAPANAQAYTLDQLIGKELVDANGSPVDPASLKGKFVGIYFSAQWCGPCRTFTPKLVEFRNQIPDQFDVVFASSDRDAAAMLSYMKEAGMPWPALPFGSPQKALLDSTFNIRSIPDPDRPRPRRTHRLAQRPQRCRHSVSEGRPRKMEK